ncbi:protein serine/threonine phosphatase [Neobacillus bataviensis LMG 21833]|uniref:protein-serine/threonine phosphatase n=1 Tax=Neobacillus bataviensis LMG 21833 TaxID=1117379 RepID=K6BYX8_9BACI|nr:Stp1/IreP family PP2C-type Ser/Thr phosphatase [Neobacillus bataviensis]EKN64110.1 protein serine/threonine phosphatase [Neobacillus bataviensis LMG 21833]
MKAVYKTDQGRVRQNNEDSGGTFVNKDGHRLAIVADGMGGHRAGDVASKMSVAHLQESWEQTEGIKTADDAEKWLRTHIIEVNQLVFDHANNHEECDGMGTTIEAVIATNQFATIAHVGDSRCYIFNDSGFQQLTEDHTLVNELVRTGQITKEDAEHHPRKNVILRAIGTEQDVKIDTKTIIFEEGDILLLCSDGLSNKVKEDQMISILHSEDTLEQKALSLINRANENGGEDNITLIILEFDDNSERG